MYHKILGAVCAICLTVSSLSSCAGSPATDPERSGASATGQSAGIEDSPGLVEPTPVPSFSVGDAIEDAEVALLPNGLIPYTRSDGTIVVIGKNEALPSAVHEERLAELTNLWSIRVKAHTEDILADLDSRLEFENHVKDLSGVYSRDFVMIVELEGHPETSYRAIRRDGFPFDEPGTSLRSVVSAAEDVAKQRVSVGSPWMDIFVLAEGAVPTRRIARDVTLFLEFIDVSMEINSADGVSVGLELKNLSDKTIKYVRLDVKPRNAVDDYVSSRIGGRSQETLVVTGPVESGAKSDTYWNNVWYNATIVGFDIGRTEIEYMDGTVVVIEESGVSVG